MNKKKIIAIIPARAGSKGIPRKNVKLLVDKPMIAYIIESVKSIGEIERVIVSTEDQEIAEVSQQYGAEVPFMRPPELADDQTTTLPVLQHALAELKKTENYIPDYVLLVYPTSPLLSAKRIQEAVDLALAHDEVDSVVTGALVGGHYWKKSGEHYQRLYPIQVENRQYTEPLFKENGALYLNKTSVLSTQIVGDAMLPLIMGEGENVDIDEPADFKRAEEILLSQKKSN